MSVSSNIIRQQFIDFFKSKGHLFIPSSPVVPQDDPTLLFTNAGMNQFKTVLLGENPNHWKRAANSQKCMRVSGKHNDLEEVGRDHHHHTFFEMLGNWSFGDYYKKEAIGWAWELLTGVWKLPTDKLYATIYKEDDEALGCWKSQTDIDHAHIRKFGEKSNFWEMGDTGPCGPCSEVHIDIGPGRCINEGRPGHVCEVNADACGRYIELWNLVFMQYNRQKDGSLRELPAKNVDTGMGFERVVAVLQNVNSNYETDLFKPIIAELEKMSGKKYGPGAQGTPFRVIADHIRALVFAITDGAVPSNDGRGYVVRRLLRRAYRFGRELGFKGPFIYKLVPVVVKAMGEAFPEITKRVDYVQEVISSEEKRFGQTLEQGIEKFNQQVAECKSSKRNVVSGAAVFLLYDTYGFPMDLTRLMAEEQSLTIDEPGFEKLMDGQRERGREAIKKGDGLTADGWTDLAAASGTAFTGYDRTSDSGAVYRYKKLDKNEYLVCLDKTPFYAESGGQAGDRGVLKTQNGKTLAVVDTFKWNDTVVHKVKSDAALAPADFGGVLTGTIDIAAREATMRNHSATHLLQAALRNALGDHVQQSGSRVDPEQLRFDFTHFKALTKDEITSIERQVNEWVLADLKVDTKVKNVDEAKKEGAMALFGEKYGENVRVVSMGAVSKELCGGTHASTTGQIGQFHITAESSIAAGIRRIEGVTGLNAWRYLIDKENTIGRMVSLLKANEESLYDRVSALADQVKDLECQLKKAATGAAAGQVGELIDEAKKSGGPLYSLVKDLGKIDKPAFDTLIDALSDSLKRGDAGDLAFVLGAVVEGKVSFFSCATQSAVQKFGIHCGELVKIAAKIAGGGGGGSPARASAGGKEPKKVEESLGKMRELLAEKNA